MRLASSGESTVECALGVLPSERSWLRGAEEWSGGRGLRLVGVAKLSGQHDCIRAINYYTNGRDDISFMHNKMNKGSKPTREKICQRDARLPSIRPHSSKAELGC